MSVFVRLKIELLKIERRTSQSEAAISGEWKRKGQWPPLIALNSSRGQWWYGLLLAELSRLLTIINQPHDRGKSKRNRKKLLLAEKTR